LHERVYLVISRSDVISRLVRHEVVWRVDHDPLRYKVQVVPITTRPPQTLSARQSEVRGNARRSTKTLGSYRSQPSDHLLRRTRLLHRESVRLVEQSGALHMRNAWTQEARHG
jgi:hypothetical protein